MTSGSLKGIIGSKGTLNGTIGSKGTLNGLLSVPKETFARNYELLDNKPQIENVELIGNKMLSELGICSLSNTEIDMILNS